MGESPEAYVAPIETAEPLAVTGYVPTAQGTEHAFPPDVVRMTLAELQVAIRDARDELRVTPPASSVVVTFSTALALTLDLISTSTFTNALNLQKYWGGAILGLAALMWLATAILGIFYLVNRERRRSELEIVQDILDQMERRKQTGRVLPPKEPSHRGKIRRWWYEVW